MENHYRYDIDTQSHVLLTNEEVEARQAEDAALLKAFKDGEAESYDPIYVYDLLDETDPETGDVIGLAYYEVTPEKFAEIFAPPTSEQEAAILNAKRTSMVVSMRQARLALLQSGLLSSVDDSLNALPEPDKSAALIEWEYATEVRRASPLVESLSAALSLSPEQLDDLFNLASTL